MNTRKFEDLGFRELSELKNMIEAYIENGIPEDFNEEGITWEFNPRSGKMFFVNEDYQVCMLNGGELETWYNLPYSGQEGFREDLINDYENGNIDSEEDREWVFDKGWVEYTMKDLRENYEDLKENISAEEYEIYKPEENEKEIYIVIGNEEILINKKDNTVTSSFGSYNSVHDIVEELKNR